jgi:hypothetical protein
MGISNKMRALPASVHLLDTANSNARLFSLALVFASFLRRFVLANPCINFTL